MRLIDADNMRKPSKGMFIYQDEFEDDVQHVVFNAYTKDDIEREPTVKAIPIEWIKKQIQKALDSFSVDLFYVGSLKHLIKEWEKENETDRWQRVQ